MVSQIPVELNVLRNKQERICHQFLKLGRKTPLKKTELTDYFTRNSNINPKITTNMQPLISQNVSAIFVIKKKNFFICQRFVQANWRNH